MSTNQTREIDEVLEAEIDLRAAQGSLEQAHGDAQLSVVGLLHPLALAETAQSLRVALATVRFQEAREASTRGRRSRARVARWRIRLGFLPLKAEAIPIALAPIEPLAIEAIDPKLTAREKRVLAREARDA